MRDNYPVEKGQRMLVRPNEFGRYGEHAHRVVGMGDVVSTERGIMAINCTWVDDDHRLNYIDIPLFLLWRIADEEDLLSMHERYVHSKFL